MGVSYALEASAVPAEGYCAGVKYGTFGTGALKYGEEELVNVDLETPALAVRLALNTTWP